MHRHTTTDLAKTIHFPGADIGSKMAAATELKARGYVDTPSVAARLILKDRGLID